jgi:hypothetical protein
MQILIYCDYKQTFNGLMKNTEELNNQLIARLEEITQERDQQGGYGSHCWSYTSSGEWVV